MSLINDALRRTSQTKKEQPPDASSGAPMQPVNPTPAPSKIPFFGPMALIVLLAVVLSLASWFFWKGWQTKSKIVTEEQIHSPVSLQAPAHGSDATPALEKSLQPIATPAPTTVINPTPVAESSPSQALEPKTNLPSATVAELTNTNSTISSTDSVATIAPTPATAPSLKLQGIFYRPSNPTAMINGRSVAVGELISGARVTKIDKEEVTLEWNGQTIALTMR